MLRNKILLGAAWAWILSVCVSCAGIRTEDQAEPYVQAEKSGEKSKKGESPSALTEGGDKQQADQDFNRGELVKFSDELTRLKDTLVMIGPPFLSRPEKTSVNLNVVFNNDAELYVEYGSSAGMYSVKTPVVRCAAYQPQNILLGALTAGSRFYYRVLYRQAGMRDFNATAEYSFVTAREPSTPFVFAIQADAHLDINTDYQVYTTTLNNIKSAKPDFLIDLGDTFLCEKYARSEREVELRYLRDRYQFFSLLSPEVPLFLTIGNHEGENGWILKKNGGKGLAYWAMKERKLYYPGPVPDDFYQGCSDSYLDLGLRESYYAFEWGGVLFIVLDPFWYSTLKGKTAEDGWGFTLGEVQYQWLKSVLAQSKATFKFVFIHHLVGGLDRDGRGGIEAVPFFEWGGHDKDGTYAFNKYRVGWDRPIHELLKASGVDEVFHGHDHQFMYQKKDGIVYQLLPQPSAKRPEDFKDRIADFGYTEGDFVGGSGYLKVSISAGAANVQFIRTFLPDSKGHVNGEIAYEYSIVHP